MFKSVLKELFSVSILTTALGMAGSEVLAQNGAYFHAATMELRVYTGNSGHEVVIQDMFDFVIVSIDSTYYPVTHNGGSLLAEDVELICVQGGTGDDDIDLSAVSSSTIWPNLGGADIYMDSGDDTAEGTDFVDFFFGGAGTDVASGNGGQDSNVGGEVETFTQ